MQFARRTLIKLGAIMIAGACTLETTPADVDRIGDREIDRDSLQGDADNRSGGY